MKFRLTARHTVTHVAEIEALDSAHARRIWEERHARHGANMVRQPPLYSRVEVVDIQPLTGWKEPGKAG